MIFIPYHQLYTDVLRLIPKLPKNLTCVLGVPRSGMIPATMIATELNLPLGSTTGLETIGSGRRLGSSNESGGHALVIDDSVASGRSMEKAKEQVEPLKTAGVLDRITYAAVYLYKGETVKIHKFGRRLGAPRIFEWNLFNSGIARRSMFDMDGVICFEPEAYDDDGPKYEESITTVKPLHHPRQVGAICTGRLERWRGVTEHWLAVHDIQCGRLFMHPAKTAPQRRKRKDVTHIKGTRYKQSDAPLFIESSKQQSPAIARVSGKPVLCLQDKKIYTP